MASITCHVIDTRSNQSAAGMQVVFTCLSHKSLLGRSFKSCTVANGQASLCEDEYALENFIQVPRGINSVWQASFDTASFFGQASTIWPSVEIRFCLKHGEPQLLTLFIGPSSFSVSGAIAVTRDDQQWVMVQDPSISSIEEDPKPILKGLCQTDWSSRGLTLPAARANNLVRSNEGREARGVLAAEELGPAAALTERGKGAKSPNYVDSTNTTTASLDRLPDGQTHLPNRAKFPSDIVQEPCQRHSPRLSQEVFDNSKREGIRQWVDANTVERSSSPSSATWEVIRDSIRDILEEDIHCTLSTLLPNPSAPLIGETQNSISSHSENQDATAAGFLKYQWQELEAREYISKTAIAPLRVPSPPEFDPLPGLLLPMQNPTNVHPPIQLQGKRATPNQPRQH